LGEIPRDDIVLKPNVQYNIKRIESSVNRPLPDEDVNSKVFFVFNDKKISYPALMVLTVQVARVRLSSDLRVPENEIQIHKVKASISLRDLEPLCPGTYEVKRLLPISLHCFLFLKPTPVVGSVRLLTREITIDFNQDGIRNVNETLLRFFPHMEFPFSGPLKVLRDDMEVSSSTFLHNIPADSVLMIEYPAPAADAVYFFHFSQKRRETLSVPSNATVADVKAILLPKFSFVNALSSVLKFTFWQVELKDGDYFSALGIPSKAEIEVGQNGTKEVRILLPDGNDRVFLVTGGDRVASLKGFLGREISRR
jgi:hypothetical protein